MSALQRALQHAVEREDLPSELMEAAIGEIMGGAASAALVGGFLAALRCKGESVAEIAAAARVLRRLVHPVRVARAPLLDLVGTGGDGASIFNVSTASAFVCACAGAHVAKHGNRAVSSASGSADVLEEAGMNLDASTERVEQLIASLGVGFLFAPKHHGAMRHAAPIRRELGIRSVFNLLGPLTNPAFAPHQVLGVYAARWLRPLAEVMRELGSKHVLVVHADDGLDELSLAAPTQVAELRDGEVIQYRVAPEQFGLARQSLAPLKVENAVQSLALIRSALGGAPGPAADILALNAGAGLYAADLEPSLASGITRAQKILASGDALRKLQTVVEASWP